MIIGAEVPGPWAPGAIVPGSSPAAQASAASAVWQAVAAVAPSVKKKKPAATSSSSSPAPSNSAAAWPTWMPWALGLGAVGVAAWLLSKKGGGGRTRRNPPGGGDADAVKFYEDFHWGRKPRRFKRVKVSRRPRRLVQLGVLEAVTYSAKKGADALADYIHHFGEGGTKRPVLAADPSNKRLHIVGGGYDVRPEGITG